MKKKILSLLAAFFMLFGTSAMAQVDSTLEGDVNGDGVVDIADITAVIAIIKQNAEANPTYYWYFGTEKLTTDEQIESKGTKISKASEITNPLIIPSEDEFVYLYYPKAFGKATLTQSGLASAGRDVDGLSGFSLTNYYGWRFTKGNMNGIIDIKF